MFSKQQSYIILYHARRGEFFDALGVGLIDLVCDAYGGWNFAGVCGRIGVVARRPFVR
jgi:hypothetical protein